MMRRFFLVFTLCFTGCSTGEHRGWTAGSDATKVLCTTAIVEDMVAAIGGAEIDTCVLIQGALNPHSYELVKGDDEKLQAADLIFYSGLGLEHGPSLAAHLDGNERAVSIGGVITTRQPGALLFVDGQVDPHIWMDVSLWMLGVEGVVDAFSAIDPEHSDLYRERGERYREKLQKLDQTLYDEMREVSESSRYLVTSHDAFNYFSKRYLATEEELATGGWKKRCTAPEGLAPDGQLSTVDIQNVIAHMVHFDVSVLFPESNLSRDSILKIQHAGRKMGLDVHIAQKPLYGDAMGSGENYASMMTHNVRVIKEALLAGS